MALEIHPYGRVGAEIVGVDLARLDNADLAQIRASFAEHGVVFFRDQTIDEGLFGGPLRNELVARLGDVVLIPHTPIAFLDPADTGETGLVARHGSLTAAEMLVPLLALGGDGIIGG